MSARKPYLVQRLLPRTDPSERHEGVDKFFQFDYMGSAEFEFGACSEALKAMASNLDSLLENPARIKVSSGDDFYTVWYTGAKEDLENAEAFFRDQISDCNWHLKEGSRIKDCFFTEGGKSDYFSRYIGWWAIDEKVPWCIFKKKTDAVKFYNGVVDYKARNGRS